MQNVINKIVKVHFEALILKTTSMGGGFYGKVFLVDIDKPPFKIIIKLYLFNGIAEKEALQLKTLSKYAISKIPEVYFVDTSNDNEVLVMEYIEGINAGFQKNIPCDIKEKISEEIVMNLLSIHSHENTLGFGQLNDTVFEKDWRTYYRKIASEVVYKSEILTNQNKMDIGIYDIIKSAFESYDKIFYLPIQRASLIHGDYNTWNILLTSDMKHISGVIDPFNCCYADSEFDLYQLDNANGKDFDLLNLYKKKHNLSENFEIKRIFYELFTEVNHYYDAQRDIRESGINDVANKMATVLSKL